jgi:hypothetical protein
MATVQKADIGMFDEIHALLKDFNNPRLGREEWRELFTYPWHDEADAPGYVLMDGASVVGFLGTIFSQRPINGRIEKFCNVSSWIVKPEWRGESIKMVLPLVRMPDCTVTNFSPSTTVSKIFEQLGFRYLDTHAFIFYPTARLYRLLKKSAYTLITDEARILEKLSESDRVIFRHHSGFKCGHILLYRESDREYCYCIYTNIVRRKLHFNHMQHIGNPAVFIDHAEAIGARLFLRTGTPFMKVDCRLLGASTLPGTIRFKVTSPRMFKSERVESAQVDNLYSELVILNL